MKIEILQCENGAKQAKGLTVVIDVFRAFSLEACLYAQGAERILVTGSVDHAFELKNRYPGSLLFGERDGRKCEGFDFGNSPSSIQNVDFAEMTIIHTTSNGTRGILNADHADRIITGAFVNAKAIAAYIRRENPENVSLVCMGWGNHPTEEDTLCAEYIRALLLDEEFTDLQQKLSDIRYGEGKKFFDPLLQDVFPQGDFDICIQHDIFDFVIECIKENDYVLNRRVFL